MSTRVSLYEASGPMIDLFQKLSGNNGRQWLCALKRMLRKESPWGPQIFKVTTAGRTGGDSITALEEQRFCISNYAKELLLSKEFVATNGKTFKLAFIMGDEFEDNERTNENIRAEATSRGYVNPPVELAPIVRELFLDENLKSMGLLGLVIMHKPITDSGGDLGLLGPRCHNDGRWFETFDGRPGYRWGRDYGFLFLVPTSR